MNTLSETNEIISVINKVGSAADAQEWEKLLEIFTDEVWLDYQSLSGIEGSLMKKEDIIEAWSQSLPGFQATQHMITNHEVEIKGNNATSTSKVLALHYLPNESKRNIWTVAGIYNHHLVKIQDKWLIDRMKLEATIVDGNLDLPQLAQEK